MNIKCKKCDDIIHHDYDILEWSNDEKSEKYLSKLQSHADRDCNKSIYLTCCFGHTEKYFYKIEKREVIHG